MPSSYTSLHYHVIFSTRNRVPQINQTWQARLYAYIGGIVRENRGDLIVAGGTADHVHLVVRLHPQTAIADILRLVKTNSSKWVHTDMGERHFGWQDGYGAFTVSLSNLGAVREYVRNQENHHRRVSFQEELLEFLRKHEVPYDERYIWS